MKLRAEPLANVGAEVLGFDIDQPLDANTVSSLEEMWREHAILLFRGQDLSPERQIKFSRIFGPLVLHPLKVHNSEAHPELFVLENGGERDGLQTGIYHGDPIVGRLDWHMDLHYTGARRTAVRCCVQWSWQTRVGRPASATWPKPTTRWTTTLRHC